MQQQINIPVYHLQERAHKNFELTSLAEHEYIAHWNKAHRDDNYLLVFQESGLCRLMVDFQEIVLLESAIYVILPGQIHYGITATTSTACALALDAASIKEEYRILLTVFAMTNKALAITPAKCELFKNSFLLLGQMERLAAANSPELAIQSMLEVCIGLFVSAYISGNNSTGTSGLRPLLITRQFRSLLLISFREMKSPSEYAAALNISPAYLNEVVKDTTGYPVSYWIHQEIILEAKRMLFYTDNTVKEISHLLGYSDTPYFIRLFGKIAGMPPLEFRRKYRK